MCQQREQFIQGPASELSDGFKALQHGKVTADVLGRWAGARQRQGPEGMDSHLRGSGCVHPAITRVVELSQGCWQSREVMRYIFVFS